MGKVRPAGQIRPVKALNTARGVVFSTQFPYILCYYDLVCLKVWPKGPKIFQIIQKIAHPWLSAKKIVRTNSNRQVDLNLTGEKELFEAEVRGHVKEA